jgi:hypothetical protein
MTTLLLAIAAGGLLALLVIAVAAVLAFYIVGQMGLPYPIDLVLRVIVGALLLLFLLHAVGVL